jgi:hypothetical protein
MILLQHNPRAFVASAAAILLFACGGTTASSSSGGDSGAHDSTSPDSSTPDARTSEDAHETGPITDTGPGPDGSMSCSTPSIPDGGMNLGCAQATCPSGTVCVQRDYDITSTSTCVLIPPSCNDKPTCECMGKIAKECVEPGVDTDGNPGFLPCQDEKNSDGTTYLDFPCGCA